MTVLETRRLEEAYFGEVVGIESRPKVLNVVLVVGLVTIMSDQGCGSWRQVRRVAGGLVILEWLVVGDVVLLGLAVVADVGNVAVTETTLEPSPSR